MTDSKQAPFSLESSQLKKRSSEYSLGLRRSRLESTFQRNRRQETTSSENFKDLLRDLADTILQLHSLNSSTAFLENPTLLDPLAKKLLAVATGAIGLPEFAELIDEAVEKKILHALFGLLETTPPPSDATKQNLLKTISIISLENPHAARRLATSAHLSALLLAAETSSSPVTACVWSLGTQNPPRHHPRKRGNARQAHD